MVRIIYLLQAASLSDGIYVFLTADFNFSYHLNDWIGPNNIILQTKYILIKMGFYLIIDIIFCDDEAEIAFMFKLPLISTKMIIK